MKKNIKYGLPAILVLFALLSIITAFHTYKSIHFHDENSGHEPLCKKENLKWLSEVRNFLSN